MLCSLIYSGSSLSKYWHFSVGTMEPLSFIEGSIYCVLIIIRGFTVHIHNTCSSSLLGR